MVNKREFLKKACLAAMVCANGLLFAQQEKALPRDEEGMPVALYKRAADIRKDNAKCLSKPEELQCRSLLLDFASIGMADSAMYYYDLTQKCEGDKTDASGNYAVSDAAAYIKANANGKRVVMFNHSDFNPATHNFIAGMLKDLRQAGYTHFACQDVVNLDSLKGKKYPDGLTGYLTREPQYANVLRIAIEQGFKLVNYKDPKQTINTAATDNITSILKADTTYKLVVVASATEVNKELSGTAVMLKAQGFDALTVNLAEFMGHSKPSCESAIYQKVSNELITPSILVVSGQPKTIGNKGYDANVFFPPVKLKNGRPEWMFHSYLLEQNISFPQNTKFPILVKVFYQKEYETEWEKLPVDVVEITKAQETIDLFVPTKGTYIVSFTGGDGVERVMPLAY